MPTPSAPLRLLFVEDDAAIVQGLQYALTQEGYAVTHAGSLAAARAALPAGFDLLLLDVRLPDGSGFDLLREARRRNPEQPAVFLTACDDEIHTVLGLDLGADDYIAKPFRLQELLSRLRAVLRRRSRAETCALPGGVQVDLRRAEISRGGEPISLTALEYKLLLVFLARAQPAAWGHLGRRRQLRQRQHPDRLHPAAAGQARNAGRPAADRDGAGAWLPA